MRTEMPIDFIKVKVMEDFESSAVVRLQAQLESMEREIIRNSKCRKFQGIFLHR